MKVSSEKLIEILQNAPRRYMSYDEYADYLLENGVIVPPCKIGERVAVITSRTSNGKNLYIFEDTITHYRIVEGCVIMCLDNHLGVPNWKWGTVFHGGNVREEAEAALKGVKDGTRKTD